MDFQSKKSFGMLRLSAFQPNLMYVEACQRCQRLFQPSTSLTCFDIHNI